MNAPTAHAHSTSKTHARLFADLHPNQALNYAYALRQVSRGDGHGHRNRAVRENAQQVVAGFHALEATNPEDQRYLTGVRNTVNAFVLALDTCERDHEEAMQRITDEFNSTLTVIRTERMLERMFDISRNVLAWSFIPSLVGAAVAYIVYVIAPIVPPVIAHHTGEIGPVAAAFIGTFGLAGLLEQFWFSYRQERAKTHFLVNSEAARRTYREQIYLQHHIHHMELVRLWEEYTGHECQEATVYEGVLNEFRNISNGLGHTLRRKPSLARQLALRLLAQLKRRERLHNVHK